MFWHFNYLKKIQIKAILWHHLQKNTSTDVDEKYVQFII